MTIHRHSLIKFLGHLGSILIISVTVNGPLSAGAQDSPITFGPTEVENNFPFWAIFRSQAKSSAGEIETAKLIIKFRNEISSNQNIIEIDPGAEVDLEYRWDTSGTTIPPSAPIFYSWEVTDSARNRLRSDEHLFYFDDQRFDWEVLERDNLSIWSHDQPDNFGKEVMDIAILALEEQIDLFEFELGFPIRLIIYNDFSEFAEWHSFVGEFVGGQAFPAYGVTTQIVPAGGDQRYWLQSVIPHEISHLFFYQATYHPFSNPPAWLNEGIAQYNEQSSYQFALERVSSNAAAGDILRLTSLTGSFGQNPDDVQLSYDESVSAVSYMVDTYGEEGMSRLMEAYRAGMSDREVFNFAFGRNIIEFEQDWLASMGIPPGMYPTITPTQEYTPRPPPTALSLPTKSPSRTPTSGPTSEPTVTQSPSPALTDTPEPVTKEEVSPSSGSVLPVCGSPAVVFGLIFSLPLILLPLQRRGKQR